MPFAPSSVLVPSRDAFFSRSSFLISLLPPLQLHCISKRLTFTHQHRAEVLLHHLLVFLPCSDLIAWEEKKNTKPMAAAAFNIEPGIASFRCTGSRACTSTQEHGISVT